MYIRKDVMLDIVFDVQFFKCFHNWRIKTIAKRIVKLIIETRQLFCLCSCRLYFDVYILNAIVLSSKGFDRDGLGIDVNTIFIRFGKIYTQEINSESPTWRYQRYISLDFILYILKKSSIVIVSDTLLDNTIAFKI